jgi:acylphosphatase
MNAVSALSVVGHNNPPEPTPFEAVKAKINDLYGEAKNWLDGEAIANQEQADSVQKLMRLIQAAEKEADDVRKEEARPHDEAKAAIQERYNALIGKTKTITGITVLAIDACKKALAPWLIKIDEENQRKAEESRRVAEAARVAAVEAAQQRDSLEGSERFEQAARDARRAEDEARKAGNAKASAKGEGRAVTLRYHYRAEVTDYAEFARHVWTAHRSDITNFLDAEAAKIVGSGARNGIPGVTVHHERRPV